MVKPLGQTLLPDIPVLETARLRLRPYRVDDLDDAAAMWGNEAYVRFIGQRTRTRPEVWKTIQSMIGSWALLGYGYWVIETRESEFVGEIGFLEGLRSMNPSHTGLPEAGWGLAPRHWGQGYANEALGAVLDWFDVSLSAPASVCIIDPAHAASIRIAVRHGFVRAYDTQLGEAPIRVFKRPRPAAVHCTDEASEASS